MTRKELKNIKDAWAVSEGYENFIQLSTHNGGRLRNDNTDSLLIFSLENSHKFVKQLRLTLAKILGCFYICYIQMRQTNQGYKMESVLTQETLAAVTGTITMAMGFGVAGIVVIYKVLF